MADIPTITISGMTVLWLAREVVPIIIKWQLNKNQQSPNYSRNIEKINGETLGHVGVAQWREWIRLIIKEELIPVQTTLHDISDSISELRRARR